VAYVALEEFPPEHGELLVRTASSAQFGGGEQFAPMALGEALRAAVRSAGLASGSFADAAARLAGLGAPGRWIGAVVTGLGGMALALVVLGMAGLVRTAVAPRVGEIGLRRAVGGRRLRVSRDILGELLVPLAVAGWIGLGTSFAAGNALTALLPESSSFDIPLYLATLSVLVLAALVGALGPALRAASMPPVRAIRLGEGVAGGGLD
jgi:ABC-type antimicrobial peptide transport system permease subunit